MLKMEDGKEVCVICASSSCEKDDHLATVKTLESWQTLYEAVRVRSHAPIMELAKHLEGNKIPKILYHRKCRSIFTMKRDLETLKRKANDSLSEDAGASSSSKRLCKRSPSESRVYNAVCIFCNKVKFLKGSKSRETLTQAIQLRADQTLRECATLKGDEKILAVTSRDIVAAEAHYHFSCYRNYTRGVKTKQPDQEKRYEKVEGEALANLFDYIRRDIIPSKKVLPLASLTSKLESFMSAENENLRDSTKKHTVFPRSDAAATINFPLLALAATIRGRRLFEGGVNYTLHDSLLFSSINFDYVMFKSTIFGSDYC